MEDKTPEEIAKEFWEGGRVEKKALLNSKTTDTFGKHSAVLRLRAEGIPPEKVAETLGYNIQTVKRIELRFKKDKYALANLEPLAYKAYKNLVQGNPIGEIEEVRDSTVLGTAKDIMARCQPEVKFQQNININKTFIDVDLSGYENMCFKDGKWQKIEPQIKPQEKESLQELTE